MSEDLKGKPGLTKKVRFQSDEKENGNADVYDNADDLTIYDNRWADGNTQPRLQDKTTEDQQQMNVPSGKRNLIRPVAVFLVLQCLLLLVILIVVLILLIQDKSLSAELTQKTNQLEKDIDLLEAINNNLTKEHDQLQEQLNTLCCPYDWIKFGSSCYVISTSVKSGIDSREFCRNLDAQLVIISSREEQKFISSFNLPVWIGLTDEESEGDWKWIDGTEVTTTYWKSQQPDNGGNTKNEDCVQIVKKYPDLNNWNDLSCNKELRCVCEKMLK